MALIQGKINNLFSLIIIFICINSIAIAQEKVYDYNKVDKPPIFANGEISVNEYLKQEVGYPQYAIRKRIQGLVEITFIINKKGKVSDVTLIKGIHTKLDNELLKSIKEMHGWSKGLHKGKPIDVKYYTSINFYIPKDFGNYLVTIQNDTVYGSMNGIITDAVRNPKIVVNIGNGEKKEFKTKDIRKIHYYEDIYVVKSHKPKKNSKNLTFMKELINNNKYQLVYRELSTSSKKVKNDVHFIISQQGINYSVISYFLYEGDKLISKFNRRNYKKIVSKYFSDCPRFVREINYNRSIKFSDVVPVYYRFCR